MLPVKTTKAELRAANEILIHSVEILMNRVAELQLENNSLQERLHVNQRPDVKSRTRHTAALVNHFDEMRKYHARS